MKLLGSLCILGSVQNTEGTSLPKDNFCSEAPNDPIEFLKFWNRSVQPYRAKSSNASWAWNTNINEENDKARAEASAASAAFSQKIGLCAIEKFGTMTEHCAESFAHTDCGLVDEAGIQEDGYVPQLWTKEKQLRALQFIQNLGTSILDTEDYADYQAVLTKMGTRYSTATVPHIDESDTMIELEPDLTNEMYNGASEASPESFDTMKYYWEQWWNTAGQGHEDYAEFVRLSNKAAEMNGFSDTGDMWRMRYEDDNFKSTVEALWQKIKPFYEQLHGYVRFKLRAKYGANLIDEYGPMPAHIFGNMWSQSWAAIYDHVVPYPNAGIRPDATDALQSYTEEQMFEMSDEFFQSLGCFPMTKKFWEKSVLKRSDGGKQMVCHASAWDFQDGDVEYDGTNLLGTWEDGSTGDYRVKQCTVKTQKQFVTVHHEMGHIQYYQQYAHQPIIFRSGANNGFHEAIGDTIALSVNTPEHLYKVGLLPDFDPSSDSLETDVNYLMSVALDKIAFMPFGYLMDLWRWDVFDGSTPVEKYQESWDKLRLKYQGIVAPVERNADNFDPAAKFHIPNNTPYIRYFISHILQFQFYRSMCEAAQLFPQKPLYKCDFDSSKAAGEKLNAGLMLGNSEPWQIAMEAMTGEDDNNAQALLDYFDPLIKYLTDEQEKHGYPIGWDNDGNSTILMHANIWIIAISMYFRI